MSTPEPLARDELLSQLDFIRSLGTKIFLYPFIGRSKVAMIGYAVTTFLVLCTTLQLAITILASPSDWLTIINVAPNLGVCAICLIKYAKIQIHKECYNNIFLHFQDEFWNIVSSTSDVHKKIVKNYIKLAVMINRFLFYYSISLIIVVDSFPYIVMRYEDSFLGIKEYLYPIEAWYPFDQIEFYATAYLWESCMTALVVILYVTANITHATYIVFISMELRILGDCLQELVSEEDVCNLKRGVDIDYIHKRLVKRLKMLISRHEVLNKQVATLDNILGDTMLIYYSIGAVFICLTAFTSTMVSNFYKRIRYAFMCLSLVVECFCQCLLGQIISDHSENLSNLVYFSDWIYASPETKRIVLVFMMRTQQPFLLTANGYIVMSMDTFRGICRTSYQLFNLLRTVYA